MDRATRRRQVLAVALILATTASGGTARADTGDSADVADGADAATVAGPSYRPQPPVVVVGKDGRELYNGSDLANACYNTDRFFPALARLSLLADTIRRSGREAVFTVVPDKSLVESRPLSGVPLPLGRCTTKGLTQQRSLLKTDDDPAYLPLSTALARDPRQVYWHTDTHWTSVGASVFVRRLIERLDRRAARQLRFVPGTESRQGDLALRLSPEAPVETVPAELPDPTTAVVGGPGTPVVDGQDVIGLDHRWRSSRGVRGRTTLIGDSFSYLAMPVIRPALSQGHFLWGVAVPRRSLLRGIEEADTVVIQVVQRNLTVSPLVKKSFNRKVARMLEVDPVAKPVRPRERGDVGPGKR